jgi:asparagine synthetase B (glutamine-hydrolysing)
VVELALKLSRIAPKTWIKDKFFLRSWANRLLPEGIVQRRKEGFNAPVKNWVNDTGDEIYEELIENTHEIITEMFDMKKLGDYLSSGNFGANASQTIYSLFILNKWLREKQVNAVSAKNKLC